MKYCHGQDSSSKFIQYAGFSVDFQTDGKIAITGGQSGGHTAPENFEILGFQRCNFLHFGGHISS